MVPQANDNSSYRAGERVEQTQPHQLRELCVVGIGLLGTAVCHRLMEFGYRLTVWSRFRHEAEPILERGAIWSDQPFADCRVAILCLYSSEVVAEVLNRFDSDLQSGLCVIDMTTGSPQDACNLSQEMTNRGITYLEAPVSGSSQQLRDGQATVFVGGNRESYESFHEIWKALGKAVYYTGENGSASRMKLVTNLALGLNRAALAEGLSYARAMGIDPQAALEILKDSAAASRIMDTKGEKMIHHDFSLQAKLSQHLKDVRLILQTARSVSLGLPLSEVHQSLLEQAERAGWGELDNSAIIQVYETSNPLNRTQNAEE